MGIPGIGPVRPGSGSAPTSGHTETVLVWPEHAAQIGFWLFAIAVLVFVGWYFLRQGFCWKCGRETGLCQHTRYDTAE